MRIDEHTTFERIEVGGETIIGHFTLERAVGSLAYAPALFVVDAENDRIWPLAVVTCLWANEED